MAELTVTELPERAILNINNVIIRTITLYSGKHFILCLGSPGEVLL